MTTHEPSIAGRATVDSAAARQTGELEQWPASLGQSRNGNSSTRVNPEDDEDQSCAPQHTKPAVVEIRVDGRVFHSFFAAHIETHEDRGSLTLTAERWQPGWAPPPANPLLPDTTTTGAIIDGELFTFAGPAGHHSPYPGAAEADQFERILRTLAGVSGLFEELGLPLPESDADADTTTEGQN
ncbi:hypothetical protein 32HC_77 [Mycobacterium phage 32HC]|uniref:Uncharacterized protein n=1 Tax=Mycobacterium phage 32HC TaxID=1445729 RepID=W8EHF1_9CAUD|nr:hypothetical protein ST32HC_77 [Mycobacterium phage 32HC]AHJ86355.1 hypothetical protein 32HC_77 [Mycobacterium phage 32HC]